jgi:hypothetical protein
MANKYKREYHFNLSAYQWRDIEIWLEENKVQHRQVGISLYIKKRKDAMMFTLRWGIEGQCIRSYEHESDGYKMAIWVMTTKD